MNLDDARPSRGGLDAPAIAYEAGRRSVTVWPWRVASGALAAGLALALVPTSDERPEPTVVATETPAGEARPYLGPASVWHLRHGMVDPVPLRVSPGGPVYRVGSRDL